MPRRQARKFAALAAVAWTMSDNTFVDAPAQLILDAERRAARIVVTAPAVDLLVLGPVEGLLAKAAGPDLQRLEIDLSSVSFADSAVVRLAMRARESVAPAGGQVVIRAPAEVRRLFELTRTADLFAIVPA